MLTLVLLQKIANKCLCRSRCRCLNYVLRFLPVAFWALEKLLSVKCCAFHSWFRDCWNMIRIPPSECNFEMGLFLVCLSVELDCCNWKIRLLNVSFFVSWIKMLRHLETAIGSQQPSKACDRFIHRTSVHREYCRLLRNTTELQLICGKVVRRFFVRWLTFNRSILAASIFHYDSAKTVRHARARVKLAVLFNKLGSFYFSF